MGLPPSSAALMAGERLSAGAGERQGSASFIQLPTLDGFMQMGPQVRVNLSQAGSPPASSSQSAFAHSPLGCYDMALGGQGRPLTRAAKAEGSAPVYSRKRQASETASEQFTTDQDEEEPKAKRPRRKVSVPTVDASGKPLPKEEIRKAKRRITNRESARRMRQERQVKAENTARTMNQLQRTVAEMQQQNLSLQAALRDSQAENQRFREALRQAVALNEQRLHLPLPTGIQGLMTSPSSPSGMLYPHPLSGAMAPVPDVTILDHQLEPTGLLPAYHPSGDMLCGQNMADVPQLPDYDIDEEALLNDEGLFLGGDLL